jgi:hypothetical protein
MLVSSGGNWSNAANAGLFYFNANNASSNTNTNRGCRLIICEKKVLFVKPEFPCHLAAIICDRARISRRYLVVRSKRREANKDNK